MLRFSILLLAGQSVGTKDAYDGLPLVNELRYFALGFDRQITFHAETLTEQLAVTISFSTSPALPICAPKEVLLNCKQDPSHMNHK